MSSPLTAAEACCWVEHMLRVESDAAAYEWPRQPDSYDRSVALDEQSRAVGDHARSLDASDGLYVRAMRKWDAPVKPAAHYAPKRKPARRRGTKPASLPQLLSAAAHAIKEP